MPDKPQLKYRHRILILDDESGILKAVKRLLRKFPCESFTTTDPKEALLAVKNKKPPFSLIISDQRMPEIKGADFLKHTKDLSPNSIRFLITGYTDMDALVDAINKGGIHRFIAKPWDDLDFINIIEDGLLQYEMMLENKRLFALVTKQNKQLNSINEDLEQKVQKRTLEISKKNEDLETTNKELIDSLFNTIRSIDSLISVLDKNLSDHGQRVAEISIMLGQQLNFSMEELRTLEVAALLHDIGQISEFSQLTEQQSKTSDSHKKSDVYLSHPINGQKVLRFIPQLDKCGLIIRHHHENYDGSGFPDGLDEKNIPFESRIIAIADTYDKLHIHKNQLDHAVKNFITAKNVIPSDFSRIDLIENSVMYFLQQNTFSLFDPDILKIMLDLIKNKKIPYKVEMEIYPDELIPGDVISTPLITNSGKTIFNKETLLNNEKIDKIKETIKEDPLKTPIKVIENFGSESG